jgi:N-acetylglucosamine-6-sulfatase
VKKVLLLSSIVLAVVLLSGAYSRGAPVAAQTSAAKPNIVFVLTDDLDTYALNKAMPKTKSLIGEQGMTFSNAMYTEPMRCPSRASIHPSLHPVT